MTDISEVAPGLYIASRLYPLDELPRYCVPIDCAAVLRDDYSDQGDEIHRLAAHAWGIMWSMNYPHDEDVNVVLICDAGRNRSAVVAARVLMLQGASAGEAIAAVRKAREPSLGRSGGALTNQAFVDYLREFRISKCNEPF